MVAVCLTVGRGACNSGIRLGFQVCFTVLTVQLFYINPSGLEIQCMGYVCIILNGLVPAPVEIKFENSMPTNGAEVSVIQSM